MSQSQDTMVAYRERLIAYAVGAAIYFASPYVYENPVALAARPAIASWILVCGSNHIWAHLSEIWKDPITTCLGIPNRVLEVIFFVVGCAVIATASLQGAPHVATWGFISLVFALEVRLCERESWRRYRLKQAREVAGSD